MYTYAQAAIQSRGATAVESGLGRRVWFFLVQHARNEHLPVAHSVEYTKHREGHQHVTGTRARRYRLLLHLRMHPTLDTQTNARTPTFYDVMGISYDQVT